MYVVFCCCSWFFSHSVFVHRNYVTFEQISVLPYVSPHGTEALSSILIRILYPIWNSILNCYRGCVYQCVWCTYIVLIAWNITQSIETLNCHCCIHICLRSNWMGIKSQFLFYNFFIGFYLKRWNVPHAVWIPFVLFLYWSLYCSWYGCFRSKVHCHFQVSSTV